MYTSKILTKREPQFITCPSCGTPDHVYRSRSRNIFERIAKASRILGLYRCHNCNWRGYLWIYSFNPLRPAPVFFRSIFVYIVLMLTSAIAVIAVLKMFIGKK